MRGLSVMKQNTEQLKKLEEMNIYGLVRAYRAYYGVSQAEFGKRYGVSHASISDIENEKTEYIKTAIVQDVVGWLLSHQLTTPHLISSDEIKREAVEGFFNYFISKQTPDNYDKNNPFGINFVDLMRWKVEYLTQSKGDKE